ncbi:MAG: gluconate 2-dehydrogenase subunit 3 family protein [Novosphingobium sp.]|nr:gluconate 2-dehydrogenase subunit 3 family protein [Novosphingobium sp.]
MNASFEMDRRGLLGQILLLAGVATIPAGCKLSDNANGSDFTFKAEQMVTLSAFADTMIPKGDTIGALEVSVPKTFEQLMRNWASAETREAITGALGRLDDAASMSGGKAFAALAPAERIAAIKAYEVEAMKPDPDARPAGGIEMLMGPVHMDEGYARMRSLVIKLFYLTEPALTQELRYEHDPNGYIASVPVTPETRPAGGLSSI